LLFRLFSDENPVISRARLSFRFPGFLMVVAEYMEIQFGHRKIQIAPGLTLCRPKPMEISRVAPGNARAHKFQFLGMDSFEPLQIHRYLLADCAFYLHSTRF
jgi:hypothetical protein